MSKKKEQHDMVTTLEQDMTNIDEAQLPQVLAQRLELLEQTNLELNKAKASEDKARNKVAKALKSADDLVNEAKGVGNHKAQTSSFLWFNWTSKADEIKALKDNLSEMVKCGINSAEAQKELVEVQVALAESQTALLKVQETQMAYQSQIADATKFLYGLSAYNIASTQSVLINLQAVLTGASKEKLGDMARQQLFLALDQLKNQENMVLRIRENREIINNLDNELEESSARIENLRKQDEEQDSLIEDLRKQDEEQDSLIEDLRKQDEEHDNLIEDLQKQDEEQDSLIEDLRKQDEEQDNLIEDLQKQDEEHDNLIEDLQKQDEAQDTLIAGLQKKDEEQEEKLEELSNKIGSLSDKLKTEKAWNIAILMVALGSLALNILQILGVLI